MARFEPIGPFDMRREDQLVAANVIGFRLGSRKAKFLSYFFLLGGIFLLVSGIFDEDPWVIFAPIAGLMLIFVILPLLRSNERSRRIVISEHRDGLNMETPEVSTTYKWDRLGRAQIISDRLFVMIDGNCGLVIPQRATNRENLERLAAVIQLESPTSH